MTIPRTTYDQWAALPHIPTAAIQPGELLIYDGEGHVAMYVGGGYIIDAPQTGMNVQKLPMNTGWYAATFDGAVRGQPPSRTDRSRGNRAAHIRAARPAGARALSTRQDLLGVRNGRLSPVPRVSLL